MGFTPPPPPPRPPSRRDAGRTPFLEGQWTFHKGDHPSRFCEYCGSHTLPIFNCRNCGAPETKPKPAEMPLRVMPPKKPSLFARLFRNANLPTNNPGTGYLDNSGLFDQIESRRPKFPPNNTGPQ